MSRENPHYLLQMCRFSVKIDEVINNSVRGRVTTLPHISHLLRIRTADILTRSQQHIKKSYVRVVTWLKCLLNSGLCGMLIR